MKNYNMILPSNMIFSQVYGILNSLGNDYIKLIPKNTYNVIINKMNKNYIPIFDLNKDLKKQGLNRKALSIICLIDLKYWCNEQQKKELLNYLRNNNSLSNEYENDFFNMFKTKNEKNNKNNEDNSLIVIKEETWINVILKRILKKFFRK